MAGAWVRWMGRGLSLTVLAAIGTACWFEMRTSGLQAAVLSRFGRDLSWRVEAGPNPDIRFPDDGPYDLRFGYPRIPGFVERLTAGTFQVAAQARPTPQFRDYLDFGGFAPYHEKSAAGLTIYDRTRSPLFSARFPQRTFDSFNAVPPLVANTLLFIENRELLDPTWPQRNPAVEWDRFGLALASIPLKFIDPDSARAGGSTLATQIEKYRHSPDGRTSGGVEKLRQMMSASVRAYLEGPETAAARRRIVVDYLNSTPLSARPGLGEVNGIGDGLWAWFGTEFDTAMTILRTEPRTESDLALQAVVYKQALGLLLAQRRPSFYLAQDPQALEALARQHLRLLEDAGIISAALADAARNFPLRFAPAPPPPPEPDFVEQKATNAIRSRLVGMLGLAGLYELDRLDLTVETTLDQPAQQRVTQVLQRLADPAATAELGLIGDRLLGAADPARVVYSVTLYERTATANLVRVQVDTLEQPLDLNEGAKLDLGSTAKLRTLASWLEIVASQYGRLIGLELHELEAVAADSPDRMTEWTARTLALMRLESGQPPTLPALLDRAMQRTYAADPSERFFTGGGLHDFANFDPKDDGSNLTVAEAFRHSVNLVFIRMMRDIINHYIAQGPDRRDDLLDDPRHPARRTYLARFADQEGTEFLNRFWGQYKDLTADAALDRLAGRLRGTAEALSVGFRSVRPQANAAELGQFLRRNLPETALTPDRLTALHAAADPDGQDLAGRGMRAGVHPLELWLVSYLQEQPPEQHKEQPRTARRDMLKESSTSRQESYAWLFSGRSKRAQDTRIGIMLEDEAFDRLHTEWKRAGYPFDSLISSYATAIGSSADRPGALAELMGIIVNDGVRLPTERVRSLHLAAGTPYETLLTIDEAAPRRQTDGIGEQVMTPAVARVVRRHLVDIVQNGTARRVNGAFTAADGSPLAVGGKTGTGDHRFERFGPGGVVLESRVVNRTATFVFFVGDRFFGVVTAHVHGPEAAGYHFTSALPAQLLKSLAPALQPLLTRSAQTAERG
jgi:membrane peptidoglycan carboxypeptidase